MSNTSVPRRLAAILAADVVSYSRMMQAQPEATVQTIRSIFRGAFRPATKRHGGRIVKLMGDGAIVEFASAGKAIDCAVDIQRAVKHDASLYKYPEAIELRIGLHVGDCIVQGADLFGDGVNIAARLQAEAAPGSILASRTIWELAGGDVPYPMKREGQRKLKNINRPVEVVSVGIETHDTEHAPELIQQIRFSRSHDGVRLAWAELGQGEPLIKAPSWISHLDLDMRHPGLSPMIRSIAGSRRFIRFDARCSGLSDRHVKDLTFDNMVDDLEDIMDSVGLDRAPVLGISQGCPIAAAFAFRRPERVASIVMLGGFAQGRAKRSSLKERKHAQALQAMLAAGWDDDPPSLRDLMAHSSMPLASEEDRRIYAEDMRSMITAEELSRYRAMLDDIDVTEMLPNIKTPCLVLHAIGDRVHPIEQGRLMASLLPNAKFVPLDSNGHLLVENDPAWPLAQREMYSFLEEHATWS